MLITLVSSFLLTSPARASTSCNWLLENQPEHVVREIIAKTQVTPVAVKTAYERVQVELLRMPCWDSVALERREHFVRTHHAELSTAVGQISMAKLQAATKTIAPLVKDANAAFAATIEVEDVYRDLKDIVGRWEVELTLGPSVLNGILTPEAALFEAILERRRDDRPMVSVDPRDIEVIKVALQYAEPTGPVLLLERALRTATREVLTKLSGLDVVNGERLEDLESLRPYQTILAHQYLTNSSPFGGVSGLEVARSLRALLRPGGRLVIVNHRDSKPFFTLSEAKEAGFKLVRWAERRSISKEWVKLVPAGTPKRHVHRLSMFVLRNP